MCHTHTGREQAGWFLRPDCSPRSECPQFGMPAERRAQFRVPNVPISRISERAPFWIYEHAQCGVFGRTHFQRVCLCHTLPEANGVVCCVMGTPQHVGACTGRGCRVHTCVMAIGADFKMYLLHQFCSNQVEFFFYNTQETKTQKNDGPEFWYSNSVIFENFLKFCWGRCGPLWSRPN